MMTISDEWQRYANFSLPRYRPCLRPVGSVALGVSAILKYGMLWAVAFLLVGVAEELAFRGYPQYLLTTRMGFWPASLVTCLFFGFAHRNNPGENLIGLANVALIGLFACVALRRTGSLWFPIGWHMAFDWGESFFYSVPNSGAQVQDARKRFRAMSVTNVLTGQLGQIRAPFAPLPQRAK